MMIDYGGKDGSVSLFCIEQQADGLWLVVFQSNDLPQVISFENSSLQSRVAEIKTDSVGHSQK